MGPYIRKMSALDSLCSFLKKSCLKMIIHLKKSVKHVHSEDFPNHSSL